MKTIVNGAPGVVDYGTQDLSTMPYARAPEEVPQHLPKFFFFAQKGPATEELLAGNELNRMYGSETFSELSPYFSHQTLFLNASNAAGNASMCVRMIPTDAGPKPTLRVWMDVLPTTVDLYERNSDGSIKLDVASDPIVIGTTQGYRVKFVVDNYESAAEQESFGGLHIIPGDQIDTLTGVQSQRYPIFEQEHSFIGSDGNLAGIRLWAQTSENTPQLPSKMMLREKAYPYSMSVIRRSATTGSAAPVETLFGEQDITITFKEGVVDPLTRVRLYMGERAIDAYQNLTDSKYAKTYGEFGRIKIYQENIELLLSKFHTAEIPHVSNDHDFGEDPSEKHLFNFVTGVNSNGVPYHSFIFVDSVNSVRFSPATNVYARGGSDGTMNNEMLANLVGDYMERYSNPNDELNDLAYHVESHIYDSGFPLETKYKLINFLAERKDTLSLIHI